MNQDKAKLKTFLSLENIGTYAQQETGRQKVNTERNQRKGKMHQLDLGFLRLVSTAISHSPQTSKSVSTT